MPPAASTARVRRSPAGAAGALSGTMASGKAVIASLGTAGTVMVAGGNDLPLRGGAVTGMGTIIGSARGSGLGGIRVMKATSV